MTDDERHPLESIPPLGRSVEDVEADAQNRVNPSEPREERGGTVLPWADTSDSDGTAEGIPTPGVPVVPIVPHGHTDNDRRD